MCNSEVKSGYLLYGLIRCEVFFKALGPLCVGQHYVVGDWCTSSAFGLDIGPVLSGQVKPHDQVTLWDIHTFLHNAGGNKEVGFMGSKLA